jgi:hypothetical protein
MITNFLSYNQYVTLKYVEHYRKTHVRLVFMQTKNTDKNRFTNDGFRVDFGLTAVCGSVSSGDLTEHLTRLGIEGRIQRGCSTKDKGDIDVCK